MAINRQQLAQRFQTATGCDAIKADQHTQHYLWQCARAVLRDHYSLEAGAGYYIDATAIQNTLSSIQVRGQRHYVWQTFQSFNERVFDIISLGSNINKKYTMVRALYSTEDILTAAGNPQELWEELYKPWAAELARQDYDTVTLDVNSLSNYIKSNQAQDRNNTRINAALVEQWDLNLKHAQRLLLLAQARGGELIQIHSHSAFGRRYYAGTNLQTTPKIVRHAALGHCHEYDIESSVFAWKLSWFREICRQHNEMIARPATLEYLDHKQALRRRLALAVFDTESDWALKIIKEFITAIGFGAPTRSRGYVADGRYQKPALAQIITSRDRLDRALSDAWVQEFMQEQKDMNTVIVEFSRHTRLAELKSVEELWDRGNKIRPNSVVSYLYQHAEREILDWLEQFCSDREVLLTVHDCIYTRQPVKLQQLREGLAQFGEFYRISHQEHQAWTWQDPLSPSDPLYDPREVKVKSQRTQAWPRNTVDLYTGAGYTEQLETVEELD